MRSCLVLGLGGSHCLVPGTNVHKEKLNMHVAWRVAVVWKRFIPLSCGKVKILRMQQLQQLQRDSDANCLEPLASSWQQKVLTKYFNSVFPSMHWHIEIFFEILYWNMIKQIVNIFLWTWRQKWALISLSMNDPTNCRNENWEISKDDTQSLKVSKSQTSVANGR